MVFNWEDIKENGDIGTNGKSLGAINLKNIHYRGGSISLNGQKENTRSSDDAALKMSVHTQDTYFSNYSNALGSYVDII